MKTWEKYHQKVGDKPNSLVAGALKDFVTRRSASLDLGAGNLRDSRFLKNQGFRRVVAVDHSEESLEFAVEGIELHISPIESFIPEPDAFDFACSCNTLFFLEHVQVATVFRNVFAGLRPGGIFACNVLGKEDDWVVQGEKVSSFTEDTLKSLCENFKTRGIGELRNRSSVLNAFGFEISKFWHQLSIVVEKP